MLEVEATSDQPDAAPPQRRGATAFIEAMATVAHHSSELIALIDRAGILAYANPAASLIFGIALDDAIGASAASFLHPDDANRVTKRFAELVATPGSTITDTVRFVSALQEVRILEIVATNCLHDPHVAGIIVNGRDVTERRQLETDLLEQSLHDALTGLPNRALFIDRAERLLAMANRDQVPVSVLFVDLDNFKTFNDGMGHPAGDELLVAVARRMSNTVRAEDLLCRFGGDEFVVLVDPRPPSVEADALAERLADVLRTPFEVDGRVISVTASVGIANGVDLSVEDLVRDADIAMYQAKAAGKNQVVAFAPEMVDIANERLQLVIDLQRAIEEHEFVVLFQPIIELGDQAVTGMEALVRWQHPTRGRLAPFEFIPAAEENGMIVDIGRLVLGQACEQAVSWQFADRDLTLSVNLSARQLSSATLLEDVSSILEETGFDASSLVLEITETTIMQDAEAAVGRLSALKELGVRLAIDDFGTGYSSLSYLRKIPVDILKIDRSFVSDLHDSTEAVAIVHSLIDLGRTLDLELVAEGVELEDQLRELRSQHCNKAQGFLFARPLDAWQLEEIFHSCAAGQVLHLPSPEAMEASTPTTLVH
jgi:diguanylate cyclase (GGDEF)-like protein/PAS domain S-box-containing protein